MSVKKNVLEKKSDRELEEYLKPGSRFTPQAINLAYEILKSRGREFSDEQIETMSSQIDSRPTHYQKPVHANEISASNLIFASAFLGVVNVFFSIEIFNSAFAIFIVAVTLSIIISLGVAVRRGVDWIKYLLLGMTFLGLFSAIPIIIQTIRYNPISGIINVVQSVLQIIAIFILFLPRKK